MREVAAIVLAGIVLGLLYGIYETCINRQRLGVGVAIVAAVAISCAFLLAGCANDPGVWRHADGAPPKSLADAERDRLYCRGEYAKVKAGNPNANDAADAVMQGCMADRGSVLVHP